MPKPKDIVSQENKPNQPSLGKRFVNFLRKPISKMAADAANQATFTMQNRTNVNPPNLLNIPPTNTTQLRRDTLPFTPSNGGPTQNLEGFRMDAQPGKPTIVFFGGSDFDRNSTSYKDGIRRMAQEAKKNGCGFVAYDYPQGATEQSIKEHALAIQNHLENGNPAVPKNMQAYSGYSLGSFSASYSASQNTQSAGLQIISGFSSARMAQKEGIKESMGKLNVLVGKDQLDTVMDTALESRNIRARLGPDQGNNSQMPISVVYSDTEDFGKAGNRHMTPVIRELQDANQSGVDVQVDTSGTGHLAMLSSPAHENSFKNFVTNAQNHVNQRQALQQNLNPTPPKIGRSKSVGDLMKEQSSGKLTLKDGPTVGKSMGKDMESSSKESVKAPKIQRSKSVGSL